MSRILREITGQRLPGGDVELVVQARIVLEEARQHFVRVLRQIVRSFLQGGQKFRQSRVGEAGCVGEQDQLVGGRHAVILGQEHHRLQPGLSELDVLISAESADHRIHLVRHQRRHQCEIHVHQRHVRKAEPGMAQHRADQRLFHAGDRIADLLALKIGQLRDAAALQRGERVQRLVDQRAGAAHGQALIDQHIKLSLVAERGIGLAGGEQARRQVRVGGRHQRHVQPGAVEGADIAGGEQRRMVRVHEPVQDHGELLFGRGALRERGGRGQRGGRGGQK